MNKSRSLEASGDGGSSTRARILDATVALMAEVGIDRVRGRAVADRAGVNPALVHYYFGTMAALVVEAAQHALLSELGPSIDAFASGGTVQEGVAAILDWIVVASRTRPGPRREMRGAGELGHVGAGLGDDYVGDEGRDPRDGDQEVPGAAKGWNMLSTGTLYTDLGGDFYTRRNPDKAKHRAIDQLRKMGYDVTLTPLAQAS